MPSPRRLASCAPLAPRRRSFEISFETQSESETREPGRTGLLSSSRIDITDHPRWIIAIETLMIVPVLSAFHPKDPPFRESLICPTCQPASWMAVVMETRVKIRTGLLRTPPFDRNGRDLLLFPPHRVRAIHRDWGRTLHSLWLLVEYIESGVDAPSSRNSLLRQFGIPRYILQRNPERDTLLA